MGILKVGSTNPKLSWILQKNPQTILDSKKPYTKEIRKGCVYGWFNEAASEFKLWFRDNDLGSSFKDGEQGEFEYLDCSRYGSAYLPISLITNCLATALKKVDENDVDGFEAYVTMVIKVSSRRYQEMLTKSFECIAKIEEELLYGSYSIVTIRAPKVYTVLNVAQIVCLMQCLHDEDMYVRLDKSAVEKFITCLNAVDAPYFVRYLFSVRTLHNRDMFKKLLPSLQREGTEMQFGNTRQQRFDAIEKLLTGGETMIDIGCGEMFYSLKLSGRYRDVFAVDCDPEVQEINRGKVAKRQIENVVPVEEKATPEWVKENESMFDGADVLLTEVIEHMSQAEAQALIESILKTNYRKLIVTTPNKDFNQFYGFDDDQMRHSDHQWEMSWEDLGKWNRVIWENNKDRIGTCERSSIGDSVEGVGVTCMFVFEREMSEATKNMIRILEIIDPEPDTLPCSTEPSAWNWPRSSEVTEPIKQDA